MVGYVLLLITTLFSNTAAQTWQLSDKIFNSNPNNAHSIKPPITTQSLVPEKKNTDTPATAITFKNIANLIDYGAFLYAAYKIYHAYDITQTYMDDTYAGCNKFTTFLQRIFPQQFLQAPLHAAFIAKTVHILSKTLLYKTIIKLLLLCGSGDLTDLMHAYMQKNIW